MRNVLRFASVLLAVVALNCGSSHTEGSTETGNPPVIDVDRIALETNPTSEAVHVVGKAGAVPPGATVSVDVLGTDQKVEIKANASGGFDVAIDNPSPSTIVEVRVGAKNEQSAPIFVTANGAVEGDDDSGKLSCMQRTNIASQIIGKASEAANQCMRDQDCYYVSPATVCTSPCGDVVTGRNAVPTVEAAVQNIDSYLCQDFMSDGCQLIIPPCIPMLPADLRCVNGRCEEVPRQ
jgi:hypothetical protein